MIQVFLGLGSNREPRHHLARALDALAERYGQLRLSSVYESEAVNFAGDNFLNLVVELETDEPVPALSEWLKALEDRHGRRRDLPKYTSKTLDVDILTYGATVGTVGGVQLPRAEILENAFVLRPLAEIAANVKHPVCGQAYGELWHRYRRDQKLWPVPFSWRDRVISPLPEASLQISES